MTPAPQTDEQLRIKRQRQRSIAIAIVLAVIAATFYALTIIKLGPNLFDRPL